MSQATVQTLAAAIHCVVMSAEIQPKEYLTDGPADECHRLINEVVNEADSVLITREGSADFAAMRDLERIYGYKVTKGESDSFGWLSGVIHTAKGKIVYG